MGNRKGPKPSCLCGHCPLCRNRARKRKAYHDLTIEQRRAQAARRDQSKVKRSRAARNERLRQDPEYLAYRKLVRDRPEEQHKNRARHVVNHAISDGKLTRQPCERCGNPDVHAHHDDYDKPLEVRWLCQRCHTHEHHYRCA
jgi:ribosomal protein S27AE